MLLNNQGYQSKSDVIVSLLLPLIIELKMSENENLKLKEKHFYNSKGIVSHLRFLKKKILWIFMAQLPSRAIAKKNQAV